MRRLDKMDYKLPKRFENSHKGTYGRVLNFAGSDYMPGAAYLSSVSALKIGCGYCFLCSTDRVINIVATKSHNVVFLPHSKLFDNLDTFDVVEVGCGLSQGVEYKNLLENLLSKLRKDIPLLVDADGINIIANNPEILLKHHFKNVVLTPHPQEAARLLNCSVEEILSDTKASAQKISQKYNCITVLKTHRTVVVNPSGEIYENTTGNSAMAKAGSGDVLAGMISGLIAQGMNIFEGACLGVYLHGLCGDIARDKLTEYSVLAEDLITHIPDAIKVLQSKDSENK